MKPLVLHAYIIIHIHTPWYARTRTQMYTYIYMYMYIIQHVAYGVLVTMSVFHCDDWGSNRKPGGEI